MSAERVLVTGGSGFVGRQALAPLVARGFAVHASTTRPDAAPAIPGVTWHAADLLSEDGRQAVLAAARPARILHCAWYVAHGRFWTAPENAAWLQASEALLDAFIAQGGRRFVGVGSCAEYAMTDPADGTPWPESRPLAPTTPYGQAKAALAARLAAAHASTAWARLFLMFGPGEAPARLVPSVLGALLAGEPARCASGTPVRDFASTWFIGQALAALVASDVRGAVNIGSGQATRIADLVRGLGAACGRPELVQLGALPDRPDETPYMVADVTRLRQEVGFTQPCDLAGDLERLRREWPVASR